jgi:cathepsin F
MTKFESNKFADVREPSSFKKEEPTYLDESSLPDSFDWRDKGAVNPVRVYADRYCYASWSFAVPESIEGEHFIKKGTLFKLSPQQFIDCTPYCDGCKGCLTKFPFSYA